MSGANPAVATKSAKPIKIKKPAIEKLESHGDTYASLKNAPQDVKNTVLGILQDVMGFHEARGYDHVYPVDKLITRRDSIVESFTNYGEDITDKKSKMHNLLLIIDEFYAAIKAQLKDKIARGVARRRPACRAAA